MTLLNWWQVTPPHHDIRTNKRLNEAIFAADLGQVVRGEAHQDYQHPVRFFAGTYLSEGLRGLLRDALRELAGSGTGNRVIQIETPFGGGKTHTLLALYHLACDGAVLARRPEVAAILHEAGLSDVPKVRVATFYGTDPSVVLTHKHADGIETQTLWGQIAYQLGGPEGYALMRRADEAQVAPGADALRELLAGGPAKLILMDELVNYIVAAAAITVGGTTLKDQTISFLQQLTQAVAQTPRTLLLLTIPSSQTEIYGQAAKDLQQDVFAAASQVSEVVGRIQTVRTPVQGDDIYEVLRRRLLEQPANEAARVERITKARQIATAYGEMYRASPNDFPQEVQEPAYVERMVRAYPFHPDIVRILYERWGTLPDFQRTRGALRILGLALADLFATNTHAPLILPSHLNLAPGDLRNELVRVLDNSAYNNVLDSDIAGSGAKTGQIDGGMGREHARFHPAVRTATTIFLWSFSGSASETRGASDAQIRVGVLTPEMQPAIVGNVLNEFRRRLWYLHEDTNSYRFDTQANLNRVIVQKEEGVTAQAARKAVEDELISLANTPRPKATSGGLFGLGGAAPDDMRTYLFPKSSQDVADSAATAVVLLRPNQHASAGTTTDALPSLVGEIMRSYGDRPRQYRNTLVVLVPDTTLVAEAENAARRLLALRAAKGDVQLALPENQRTELAALLQSATEAFPQQVGRLYRSVVIPAALDVGGMERLDLGLRPFMRGATLWDDAFARLRTEERFLDNLAPSLLANNHFGIWPKEQEYLTTQRLWDAFVGFPHLPMLAGKRVLINAIAAGCNEGLLGYAVGDAEGPPFQAGRFAKHNPELSVEITPATWVLKANYAREKIVPHSEPVYDIPPSLLLESTIWPTGSSRRALADVWAGLVSLYAPRPIAGPHVLIASVYSGVEQKLFRVSINGAAPGYDVGTLQLNGSFQGVELVRAEKIAPGKLRFLTIDVHNVQPNQLSKIMLGVLNPLKDQGATVSLRLVIDADAPNGIKPEVIELTIKETFKQLGLSADFTQAGGNEG